MFHCLPGFPTFPSLVLYNQTSVLGHLRGEQLERGSEHAQAGVQGERNLAQGCPRPFNQGWFTHLTAGKNE